MKILEIEVKGLFGTFDHIIPLAFADRVTIIHGPNGFGKTMMLKMIASLIVGRIAIFERVPFSEFIAKLDNGSTVSVRPAERILATGKRSPKAIIVITDEWGVESSPLETNKFPDVPRHVLDSIDQYIPSPYSRSGPGWLNRTTGEHYNIDQILDRFPSVLEHLPEKYRTIPSNFFSGLEVFFVETKRLDAESSVRRPEAGPADEFDFFNEHSQPLRQDLRVEQYSEDIVRRIKAALGDYARNSQERDRTFPERLVSFVRDEKQPLPEKEIVQKMAELEKKRQRLISLGFLDSETGLHGLTEDDVRRAPEALTIYVSDVQLKLAVFDDLADRVGRLMDIVNDRFKYKTLTLQREHGFRLRSAAGETVKIEDLSSGEQHELVVLYELLFRAPKNGLVLVDEPEISLHVAWQSRFLRDLMGILALTNSYGIVATHSPVIIGTRWDITKELQGPVSDSDEVSDAR